MIFYLIYLSSATRLFSDNDLSEILAISRLNNTIRGITGLLLYHDGNILQVLEGEKEAVMNLYFHIEEDNRHRGIIKMVSGTSEERSFPEWSMGFKTVSDIEWDEMSGHLTMNPSNILKKLKHTNENIETLVKSYMSTSLR